jgi:putative phosphoesterase
VVEELESADHVIHAGDFDSQRGHFRLRILAEGNLTAVAGNRDPDVGLPEVATVECGGVRFAVTHGDDYGRGESYRRGLLSLADSHDADVAVGGHTHRIVDETVDGVRLLNPGSATGADPATAPTLLSVTCDDGELTVTRRG